MVLARRVLLPALFLAMLVGSWQLATTSGAIATTLHIEKYLLPSSSEIGKALWESRDLLLENAWVTLQEILLGLIAGVFLGFGLAVAMRFSPLLRDTAFPIAVATQAVPVVALGPILLVWFGFGIVPKMLIVGLACFFPVLVSTLAGFRRVDPEAVKMMRTLYASPWAIFRRVEIPTALPPFFSGVKVAVAIAPITALFAELVGSSSGLMFEIVQDNARLETPRVFAAVVVLALIGVLLVGLTALVERLVVKWR